MKTLYLMLPALLAATAIVARAETLPRTDPADATQAGMPAQYRSAFDAYFPHQDGTAPSLSNWRAANDLVGVLGGHAGHAEAVMPAHHHTPHQSAPETLPAVPSHDGHEEHHHAH